MTVRVKLNSRGVRELLRSDEVKRDLEARAERIAAAAGPDMATEVTVGAQRVRAVVYTATPHAMASEAKHGRLSAALDAGR